MRKTLTRLQVAFVPTVIALAGLLGVSGCAAGPGGIPAGDYEGAIPCVVEATNPDGVEGQEAFTEDLSVEVGPFDSFTINGVAVEIGAMHLRSLPNADLSFEVTAIQQSSGSLQITYEPRPTLTGIEITGSLVETYRAQNGDIAVSAVADLTVESIDGVSLFLISCEGTLARE